MHQLSHLMHELEHIRMRSFCHFIRIQCTPAIIILSQRRDLGLAAPFTHRQAPLFLEEKGRPWPYHFNR